jgi:diguanylate cyclase (GGDEF)-like protein
MAVAVLPLGASALFGYLMLHHGVLGAFQDVAMRERYELDPTQHLRLLLVEATGPVDDFVDDADPAKPGAYRETRGRIEAAFAALDSRLTGRGMPSSVIGRARDDWTAADRIAGETFAVRRAASNPQGITLMDEFHARIDAAVDKLGVVHDELEATLNEDHDKAIRDAGDAERFAAFAGVASLLAIVAGLFIVGRVIAGSVERLVSGAELFAAGDRAHRIEIQLPPELHRVAQEFNQMITRIHDSENALAELARHDSLTQLPNRRAFDETVKEMLGRHQRLGEQWALLVLDLDHFKRINDSHGHGAGDDVLRVVAQALSQELRPFDRAFRIGGEEFAVILGATDRSRAMPVAERIRKSIENLPFEAGAGTFPVTASIGVAGVGPGSTGASILAAADAALYVAKENGRNRVSAAEG